MSLEVKSCFGQFLRGHIFYFSPLRDLDINCVITELSLLLCSHLHLFNNFFRLLTCSYSFYDVLLFSQSSTSIHSYFFWVSEFYGKHLPWLASSCLIHILTHIEINTHVLYLLPLVLQSIQPFLSEHCSLFLVSKDISSTPLGNYK